MTTVRLIHLNFSNIELLTVEEENFMTCPVCGYKTLVQDDKLCEVCLVELTDSEMVEEGYSSMEEFIQGSQITFFSPDSLVDNIDFYNPNVSEEGYEKDMNWKPSVPKDSVLKFNKEYFRYIDEIKVDSL